MIISEVNVTLIKPTDGLVAFASCVIDNNLYIGSLGVHKLLNGTGYRITYPTKLMGSRTLHYFHPVTRDANRLIEQAIVAKCNELFKISDEQNGRHNKTTDKYN